MVQRYLLDTWESERDRDLPDSQEQEGSSIVKEIHCGHCGYSETGMKANYPYCLVLPYAVGQGQLMGQLSLGTKIGTGYDGSKVHQCTEVSVISEFSLSKIRHVKQQRHYY